MTGCNEATVPQFPDYEEMLRDLFAGLIINQITGPDFEWHKLGTARMFDGPAEYAYRLSDAMLLARKTRRA